MARATVPRPAARRAAQRIHGRLVLSSATRVAALSPTLLSSRMSDMKQIAMAAGTTFPGPRGLLGQEARSAIHLATRLGCSSVNLRRWGRMMTATVATSPAPRDSAKAVPARIVTADRGAWRRAPAALCPAACGRPAANPTPACGRSWNVVEVYVIFLVHHHRWGHSGQVHREVRPHATP